MTSLQKQLAAIAASSTNELDLKAQKASHSKSLLFEPSIAASQSFDSIYQLCIEGFEELCELDSRFIQFANTLFSPQSKNEERTQMTSRENKELDGALERYLGLVGARLLLKPALKTVEWLVRRFRIHEYNTEASILTFLPYHDTHLFPTLLSILPKELSPSFKFLHPYIAQLKSPPRSVIVHTSIHNQGFFSALNKYTLSVAKARQQHVTLLSFWATVVTQAIDGKLGSSLSGRQTIQHQREEDLMTQLLPTLNEALSLKTCPELVIGCYMIITVLVSKADLDDTTLKAFMIAIVQSWDVYTIESGLGCLAIVAERSRSTHLPKSVVRATLQIDNIVGNCVKLSKKQPVKNLVMGLASNLIERIGEQTSSKYLVTFTTIISSGLLEETDRAKLIKRITTNVEHCLENDVGDARLLQSLKQDLQRLAEEDDLSTGPMEIDQSDHEMTDANIGKVTIRSRVEDDITGLENTFPRGIQDNSFLTQENAAIFNDVIAKCSNLITRPESLDHLLSLSAFQGDISVKVRRQISFVAYLWCTHHVSPDARYSALRIANMKMSSVKDIASLAPLALVALADKSSKVRKEAGKLFMSLSETLQTHVENTPNPSCVILGNLYGSSQTNPKNIALGELRSFIDTVIVPSLEECAADPMAICQALRRGMDSSVRQNTTIASSRGKQLTSADKLTTYIWLCSHVNSMPLIEPKYMLLAILEKVEKVKGLPRSRYLLQSLKGWAESDEITALNLSRRDRLGLEQLDAIFLAIVHPSDEEAVDYLVALTTKAAFAQRQGFPRALFRRLRQLWNLFGASKQQMIAQAFFNVACPRSIHTSQVVGQEFVGEFLKSVPISADILASVLERILDDLKDADQKPAAKRRRVDLTTNSNGVGSDEIYQARLLQLTFMLEMVEGSHSDFNPSLFQALFRSLNEIQRHASRNHSHISYPQSITLSTLLSMANSYEVQQKPPALNTTLIRPDVLVDCVRATSSPQTRNTALLLLAKLARYMPDTVLQSVMPVFTLMSESTAKQDDEFSTHVVDETVQEVIPLLAASLRQQNQDIVTSTAEIISSFAAVYDHIPSHRRLRLFKILASSLGAADCLFAIVVTLVDRYMGKSEVTNFSILLMREFASLDFLTTIRNYVDFAITSFDAESLHFRILTQKNTSQKDIEKTRYNLLSIVPELLGDEVSQDQLRKDIDKNRASANALRDLYGKALERAIVLAQCGASLDTRSLCKTIVDRLLTLLPFDQIIIAIPPFLENANDDLRKRLIGSLQHQISKERQQRNEASKAAMDFLPHLTRLLEQSNNTSLKISIILCVDKICEKFGKTNADSVLDASKTVAGCIKSDAIDPMLPSVSLYCLSSMVEILQNDFIPLLQPALKSATECLQISLEQSNGVERLHNSAYALLISVLENIPFMMSRDDLILVMNSSYTSAARSLGSSCDETRKQFLGLVSSSIDINLVFEIARATQLSALKLGFRASHEHIGLLSKAIEVGRKSTINQNIRAHLDTFLQELDLRRLAADGNVVARLTDDEVDSLEQDTIGTLISLTLKVSDTSFRPFFIRFVEWAGEQFPKSDQGGTIARLRTLFIFLGSLSERLKSLVTMYFSYVLDQTVEVLQQPAASPKEGYALSSCVLEALASGFKHDQDDFWQAPSRYDAIMPPLVSKLSSVNSSNNAYMSFIHSYVIPAIVELAATANSPDNHKQMNDVILKLLRTDSARVRLSAIKCQQELTKRVGEEWFAQLPAMLPIISELQEDDDENVERETTRWIKMIEDVLGESLNSMLT